MAQTHLEPRRYSDATYVDGVFRRNPIMERALHKYCKQYFDENYRGVFFVGDEHKDEIFQESFIKLWDNIMDKKIYAENGEVRGKNGEPLSGKLTTYFMGIAKLKYLEWARHNLRGPIAINEERRRKRQEMELFKDILYDEETEMMHEFIAECISHMSERCNQILTMFYYEEKTLDDIIIEIPTFESKNALKTAKYKCMETLRNSAKSIYHRYLNS